jgi:hypothetical protein
VLRVSICFRKAWCLWGLLGNHQLLRGRAECCNHRLGRLLLPVDLRLRQCDLYNCVRCWCGTILFPGMPHICRHAFSCCVPDGRPLVLVERCVAGKWSPQRHRILRFRRKWRRPRDWRQYCFHAYQCHWCPRRSLQRKGRGPKSLHNVLPACCCGNSPPDHGWFGFNGGSVLAASGGNSALAGRVCAITAIGASAGGLTAFFIIYFRRCFINLEVLMNGMLAGCVWVTAELRF